MGRGRVRTAAKAVIVRDGRLLVVHCRDASGDWYGLPGGGQEEGEPLADTLVRECLEEIGTRVEVLALRWVRDYIVANHDFSYLEEDSHQLEHLFECRVPDDYEAHSGPGADSAQVGVVWLDAEALRTARLHPERLADLVDPERRIALPVYWGDVG